jgi:hypothetical protein
VLVVATPRSHVLLLFGRILTRLEFPIKQLLAIEFEAELPKAIDEDADAFDAFPMAIAPEAFAEEEYPTDTPFPPAVA